MKPRMEKKKLRKRDLARLEKALCAIVDYEGEIKDALQEEGRRAASVWRKVS